MQITEIKIFPCRSDKILAFASITLDGELVVKGFRVMPSSKGDGPWVVWPSEKGKDGKWRDTVFCLKPELRTLITENIRNKFSNDSAPSVPSDGDWA